MNRDDKAHRFVVTWNAFLDGNRLAYLSLVLAIGVDALVFMAGLFGAAAVKSPLSDVPSPKARSAEQLEAIVKNALGEDRLENAELVLAAMRPLSGQGDNRSEVDLTRYDPEIGTADQKGPRRRRQHRRRRAHLDGHAHGALSRSLGAVRVLVGDRQLGARKRPRIRETERGSSRSSAWRWSPIASAMPRSCWTT